MAFYIKKANKPVEAIQLLETLESILEVRRFIDGVEDKGESTSVRTDTMSLDWQEKYVELVIAQGGLRLKTPESDNETQMASFGDYIVKGYSEQQGWHFWPVKPDYFNENYIDAQASDREAVVYEIDSVLMGLEDSLHGEEGKMVTDARVLLSKLRNQ